MEKFTNYYSATVIGTGNNNGICLKENSEYVFKSYYRLRVEGEDAYKLFFSNTVDSTGNCRAEKKGDGYTICEAYAAYSPDKVEESEGIRITFDGKKEKTVSPGEVFSTDEFKFDYKKDGYLVLVFKVKTEGRKFLPATNESMTTGRIFENGVEKWWDNFSLRPAFIGVKREKRKTVAFWGDSITQGSRTGLDKYEAWAHRIGAFLESDISFWNLGMGWARAYDASLGGVYTQKAAMCDEVFICFGVNDIRSGGRSAGEVICDLKRAKEHLCEKNPDIKVRFLTIPPFNMSEFEEKQRKLVNEYIKTTEEYFDIAKVLEKDDEGSVKDEFMSSSDDAHPNGEGGKAVFEEFLAWRERTKW